MLEDNNVILKSGKPILSWEVTAMRLAFNISEFRSPDPYVAVGACIIKNDNSILLGYNGAPSGMDIDWSNRDERRKRVLHAESNVLNRVLPGEVKLIAVTHLPCSECLKIIKQKKIDTVYYCKILANYSPDFVFTMAKEFGITLIQLEV